MLESNELSVMGMPEKGGRTGLFLELSGAQETLTCVGSRERGRKDMGYLQDCEAGQANPPRPGVYRQHSPSYNEL